MVKRLVMFAGAALLLAACDSATAPSISRFDGGQASTKAKPTPTPTTTTTPGGVQTMSEDGQCYFWIKSGDGDSTLVSAPCGPIS
jgi:hypothetical protein